MQGHAATVQRHAAQVHRRAPVEEGLDKRSPTTGTDRTGKPEGASETVDRALDLVLGRARFDAVLDRISEHGGFQAYDTP